jgi:hypothetical protein
LPQPLDQALVEILPEGDENEMSDFEAEFDEEEKMETGDSGS